MKVQDLDLPNDFVRRMRNWARYMAGGAIGAVRAMDYGTQIDGGYREADMPTIDGEAIDTEKALAAVPLRYQQAVRLFWSYDGSRSWVWLGKRMGVGVSNHTAKAWVERGHDYLRAELHMRADANRRTAELNARAFAQSRLQAA